MNQIFTVAFQRSVIHGVLAALLAAMAAWSQTTEVREIIVPAMIAGLTIILTRGLGEGAIDTSRGDTPPPTSTVGDIIEGNPPPARTVGDILEEKKG